MKVEELRVGFKDRDDYRFIRWTVDGNEYYLLDEQSNKRLANGNRIATKNLDDAFNPIKASQVGLLDSEGHEVIPFNNRSIKLVNDDVIIVEAATPVSPGVIEANRIKEENGNSAASQLVPDSATIKDKFYKLLGPNPGFIFLNQASEATICDASGNNLVMGEYYSYIALNNDKLYFSKNTADSEILEYSISSSKAQSDVAENEVSNELDVTNTEVDKAVIEDALNNGEIQEEVKNEEEKTLEKVADEVENVPNEEDSEEIDASALGNTAILATLPEINADESENEIDDTSSVVVEESAEAEANEMPDMNVEVPVVDADEVANEVANVNIEVPEVAESDEVPQAEVSEEADVNVEVPEVAESDEAPQTEANEEADVNVEVPEVAESAETPQTEVSEEADVNVEVPEVAESAEAPQAEANEEADVNVEVPEVAESAEAPQTEANEETDVNVEVPEVAAKENDIQLDSDIEMDDTIEVSDETDKPLVDSMFDEMNENETININNFDDNFGDEDYKSVNFAERDTILTDVAKSMSSLIKKTKSLQEQVTRYKNKIGKLNEMTSLQGERLSKQDQQISMLTTKVSDYEKANSRLEMKNQSLEMKNQSLEMKNNDLERKFMVQKEELEVMRPQHDQLAQVLADAQALLGEESYDEHDNIYRRAI